MPVVPIRWVLIRDPHGKFAAQALLCTDIEADPVQIVSWFVLRWQVETTFQAVRTHLGVETQRQWNEFAIQRTTPALLGIFSLVTLLADQQTKQGRLLIRQAAWYRKAQPTFADALAAVRRQLWMTIHSCMLPTEGNIQKLQQRVLEQLTETLCYAA
jgi:phosphoglycerol transferase MdoB-like AlkP superfamily enzyme